MQDQRFFAHTFHIPVLGIGYSVDTAIKVAPYGISSVISLVDDILFEKIREHYSNVNKLHFEPISRKIEDYRAKRVTAYLDMVHDLVNTKFNKIKTSFDDAKDDIVKYFDLLPENSTLKKQIKNFESAGLSLRETWEKVKDSLVAGNIDVNIMTKLDKANYKNGIKLPDIFNDAHAALRGFAKSKLRSSVVLSAGMNRRLYTYFEEFKDFFPDQYLQLKKKITLKVTDFRSAVIQGKFFAQKGLWVSEFRIESGLNCGGHTFPSDGILMGPILEEFKKRREELREMFYVDYKKALEKKDYPVPEEPYPIKVTAQGGVGTHEEHEFLLNYYNLDSVGWGSTFLLVPEVVSIDNETLHLLEKTKEEDFYLSDISPLGVKFNSIKYNTKDIEKEELIKKGTPGSTCPKQYLVSNTEFTEKAICVASRQYQTKKIEELKQQNLDKKEYNRQFNKIVEKSCICVGLGTSALKKYNLDRKIEGDGVSICPGPNLAYYNKEKTFKEMVDHIYGRKNVEISKNRPNIFLKELSVNFNHLEEKIEKFDRTKEESDEKSLIKFYKNLHKSLDYYKDLFEEVVPEHFHVRNSLPEELKKLYDELNYIGKVIKH